MKFNEWKESIVRALAPFGDLDYQARVWRGLDPHSPQMGGYEECVETLLSSAQFDAFIDEYAIQGGSADVVTAMKQLSDRIRRHAKTVGAPSNPLDLRADQEWIDISGLAFNVVSRLSSD